MLLSGKGVCLLLKDTKIHSHINGDIKPKLSQMMGSIIYDTNHCALYRSSKYANLQTGQTGFKFEVLLAYIFCLSQLTDHLPKSRYFVYKNIRIFVQYFVALMQSIIVLLINTSHIKVDVSWSCNRTTGNATYYFSRHTIVFPCIFLLGGCGYLTHISSVFLADNTCAFYWERHVWNYSFFGAIDL